MEAKIKKLLLLAALSYEEYIRTWSDANTVEEAIANAEKELDSWPSEADFQKDFVEDHEAFLQALVDNLYKRAL